jgi:hypothetical protein
LRCTVPDLPITTVGLIGQDDEVIPRLLIAAGLILGTACSADDEAATLSGRLVMVGGPHGAEDTPMSGRIDATSSSGDHYSAVAADDGTFSLEVPAGRYLVTGRGPAYQGGRECAAADPVDVEDGQVTDVQVVCIRR